MNLKIVNDYVSMASHDVLMETLSLNQAADKAHWIIKQYTKVSKKLVRSLIESDYKRSLAAFEGHESRLIMLRYKAKSL